MSRQANPVAVGGFVLGAIAILVGSILAIGGTNLLADTERYSIFFEGSVNGLGVGSPVKLQGVPIGEVVEIRAIADVDPEVVTLRTETVIEVDRRRFERRGVEVSDSGEALTEQGVRAQLNIESLLTGQLYVALELRPNIEPKLAGVESRYDEIPTMPTALEELESDLRDLFARLGRLPLEEIVQNLNSSLAGVGRLVNDPALAASVKELEGTLREARLAMTGARALVQKVETSWDPLSGSATEALDQTRQALATFERAFAPGSTFQYQLATTLQELSEAARSVQALADTLERQPNSLLFGKAGVGE